MTEPKIDDENKAVGSIDAKVYWDYIRAGAGPVLLIASVLSTLVSQSLFHYSDIWLSEWFVIYQTNNIFDICFTALGLTEKMLEIRMRLLIKVKIS